VFVQSLRPGLADELGLGREALRARNPRLVYVSINACGRSGPWAGRPGYDPLAQAATGIISVTGEPERPGVRVGVSLIDQGTGTWAALGTLAALLERATTGEGRAVDVSLYETALGLVAYHVTGYLAEGRVPGRHGTAFPAIAPYETFPTADGELMVAAGNDRLFAALVEALGVPGLAAEARFATNPDRVANRAALRELLLPRFAGLTRAEVLARLEAAGVPAAPVQDVGEVARHEQTAAIGILQQLGTLQTLGLPLQFDDARLLHRSPPPRLGEHTAEVLAEAGYTPAEIAELAASGTIALG
jgi:formyl-CoA transferase/CoA:oxalate CoA-transferase